MNKSTCEGKFHIPFRKSRKLRSLVSLYSSDSASEWAHEHQNHLLFSLSGLIHSHISFSWQEVPTGSCWPLMASKGQVPVYENCYICIPGDGTWDFIHPFSPAVALPAMNYWVTTCFFLLFYQQVTLNSPAFVFKKSPISPHAQVGAEPTPQSLAWCLPNLYSQIALKIDKSVPDQGMRQAHICLSLGTRRFEQRTNQWHKPEILLRRVTLNKKSKLVPCETSQNQSCVWKNTLYFNKTVARGVSQV